MPTPNLPALFRPYGDWTNHPTWYLCHQLAQDPNVLSEILAIIENPDLDDASRIWSVKDTIKTLYPVHTSLPAKPVEQLFENLLEMILTVIDWGQVIEHFEADRFTA